MWWLWFWLGSITTATATAITNLVVCVCVCVKSKKLRLFFRSLLTSNRQIHCTHIILVQSEKENRSQNTQQGYTNTHIYTYLVYKCIKRAKLRVIYTRCAHVFIYISLWIAIALVFFDLFYVPTYVRFVPDIYIRHATQFDVFQSHRTVWASERCAARANLHTIPIKKSAAKPSDRANKQSVSTSCISSLYEWASECEPLKAI